MESDMHHYCASSHMGREKLDLAVCSVASKSMFGTEAGIVGKSVITVAAGASSQIPNCPSLQQEAKRECRCQSCPPKLISKCKRFHEKCEGQAFRECPACFAFGDYVYSCENRGDPEEKL